ncbi:5-formyltetrahydrofolate cyclo-ligase [Rhodococcus hoagii]|nr:5-formyltetrahydrofolate cyclo-ligase [Prescottella equi]
MNSLSKAEWRAHVLRERRAVSSGTRAAEARALAATAVSVAGSTAPAGATVCAYVPVGSEPGSIEMLDALRAAGLRVLLRSPVNPARSSGPSSRAPKAGRGGPRTAGTLRSGVAGRRGRVRVRDLRPGARRGRAGHRLGRGAGFYDRTLGCADPARHSSRWYATASWCPHCPPTRTTSGCTTRSPGPRAGPAARRVTFATFAHSRK